MKPLRLRSSRREERRHGHYRSRLATSPRKRERPRGRTEDRAASWRAFLRRGLKGQNELLGRSPKPLLNFQRVDTRNCWAWRSRTPISKPAWRSAPPRRRSGSDAALSRIVAQGAGSPAAEATRHCSWRRGPRAQPCGFRPRRRRTSSRRKAWRRLGPRSADREGRPGSTPEPGRPGGAFKSSGNPDVQMARSSHARLAAIRLDILSFPGKTPTSGLLAIPLNQKRKAITVCQAALAAESYSGGIHSSGLTHPPQSPRVESRPRWP